MLDVQLPNKSHMKFFAKVIAISALLTALMPTLSGAQILSRSGQGLSYQEVIDSGADILITTDASGKYSSQDYRKIYSCEFQMQDKFAKLMQLFLDEKNDYHNSKMRLEDDPIALRLARKVIEPEYMKKYNIPSGKVRLNGKGASDESLICIKQNGQRFFAITEILSRPSKILLIFEYELVINKQGALNFKIDLAPHFIKGNQYMDDVWFVTVAHELVNYSL